MQIQDPRSKHAAPKRPELHFTTTTSESPGGVNASQENLPLVHIGATSSQNGQFLARSSPKVPRLQDVGPEYSSERNVLSSASNGICEHCLHNDRDGIFHLTGNYSPQRSFESSCCRWEIDKSDSEDTLCHFSYLTLGTLVILANFGTMNTIGKYARVRPLNPFSRENRIAKNFAKFISFSLVLCTATDTSHRTWPRAKTGEREKKYASKV